MDLGNLQRPGQRADFSDKAVKLGIERFDFVKLCPNAHDIPDQRQAQAAACGVMLLIVDLLERPENSGELFRGNAAAGIFNLKAKFLSLCVIELLSC